MWEHEEIFSLNDSSPDTLFDISMQFIVNNMDCITTQNPVTRLRMLRNHITLPAEICDRFLDAYQKKYRVSDNVAHIFRDRENTRLTTIKLRNAKITERGLRCLLAHRPRHVELIHCEYVSQEAVDVICENNDNLVSLNFGPVTKPSPPDTDHHKPQSAARNLRRLTMQCRSMVMSPLMVLRPLSNLTHLDISDYSSDGVYSLGDLNNLVSLVLHNVMWSKDNTDWICQQQNLKHLDISYDNDEDGTYYNPSKTLKQIVCSLPKLESLDISGTNLAGTGAGTVTVVKEGPDSAEVVLRCDIPGLVTRVGRPFEFLGLYGTHHGACNRHDIPAKIITGDANEGQILAAARAYFNRPAVLTRVLNDLYYLFRYEDITYIGRALNIVLRAMEQYVSEKNVQISGSATLFYVVKGKEKPNIGLSLKRRIITVLLNGMEAHIGDDSIMRNGCLTLCQFKIPVDVLYEYERVVQILLDVSEISQQWFVQRIAIYLLNSLACRVDGKKKRYMGDKGAILKMLQVISERLQRRVCDDVMEVAWSTMWNVTDETPQNSQLFLENRGMEYFQECLKMFHNNDELLRNMMGLLGNVAEVESLRPQLINTMALEVFYELLNSESDGIEVSYNAAGVLAHIASDGPEAWTVSEPSRDAVLERVALAVQRWDRKAERNINYRSFQPILTLLKTHHTPQCQHWAAWALANLTTVYPEKYCHLVEAEGGLKLLHELLVHPGPYPMIKELALVVIENCTRFAARDNPPSPESPDY